MPCQKKSLCMNPGPIEFDYRVLNEMSHKGISHVDPSFIQVFGTTLEQLRKVFLASDGQPLVVAGSGTIGWDMIGANLIEKGDKVLVINTGYFGDSFATCLEVYGAKVKHLKADVGSQPSKEELITALNVAEKYKLITITHVDTSTGVLADVQSYAEIIRKRSPESLIVVDGVCALGGEECRMQQWDLDVVITGSQKCLGVPAGLSISMIRPRAIQVFESRKEKKTSYYGDWENWLKIMKNYEARRPSYFATPAVNLIYALHESLNLLLENGGIEKRFEEHRMVSNAVKRAITALGCGQVPTNQIHAANTMTCVRYPAGVTGPDLLPKVSAQGISLAGGLHKQIKAEYFRIGHMGPSTRTLDHVLLTIQALEKALAECGHKFASGAGVKEIMELKNKLPRRRHLCPFGVFCSGSGGKCPAPKRCQYFTVGVLVAAIAGGFILGRKTS